MRLEDAKKKLKELEDFTKTKSIEKLSLIE